MVAVEAWHNDSCIVMFKVVDVNTEAAYYTGYRKGSVNLPLLLAVPQLVIE